jgi:CRISPR-associated endonuclease/helicase Cas3
MSATMEGFPPFFRQVTGFDPYPYQVRLANSPVISRVISVPTGAGKTAAVVLAWLWRRKMDPDKTPRRLVYCLPMRVMVEQTRDKALEWVGELKKNCPETDIGVHTLMGGEVDESWEVSPERPAILVGTQDMLLSRALNRGYAMSRYKWPVHFGLLNNDCLWVCDEVQLMGSGLATTTQLQAWRERFGGTAPSFTWWMSATMESDWLETVDFAARARDMAITSLGPDDLACPTLKRRREAAKPSTQMEEAKEGELAGRIVQEHQPGSLTLAVVNTVGRARRIYEETAKAVRKRGGGPELVLAHSRFRPAERDAILKRIQAPVGLQGRIVIATQVVEAGVDVSARVLFTDLAPWSSIVQRLGRCNRTGEYGGDCPARVFWIQVGEKQARPYEVEEVAAAGDRLAKLIDASIPNLESAGGAGKPKIVNVVRKKDLLDLFDTTPDLSGADIDIGRFIRDGDETDAQVFWREIPAGGDPDPKWSPRREELCPAPRHEVAELLQKGERPAYRWDWLEGRWRRTSAGEIRPGEVYLLACRGGGYSPVTGWDAKGTETVTEVPAPEDEPESYDSDLPSRGRWITVARHTDRVAARTQDLIEVLRLTNAEALLHAARWHDRGKGHDVFQGALPEDADHPKGKWAKAPGTFQRYKRRHFRHELASALAILQEDSGAIPEAHRNLAAYLAAAHHGRVRLSIRSMPGETPNPAGKRFARGIWEGEDVLEELDLGGGVTAGRVRLSLAPMEMGTGEEGRSWAERMLELRDSPAMGPFRLAYLEAVLRAADRRASAEEMSDE